MEAWISGIMAGLPLPMLLVVIAVFLVTLGKGADLLVAEAVALSVRWGVPAVVIGATIVSLGTTLPEAAVSVVSALQGNPDLALGNAVGSIIVDTGLILGLAAVLAPLPLRREVVNRQGWVQLGSGVLLVVACAPWSNLGQTFTVGGVLPQWMGFVLLGLLVLYIYFSIRWSRSGGSSELEEEVKEHAGEAQAPVGKIVVKLVAGIGLVVLSSQVLIPAVEETAVRLGVPQVIIAATLVAFGTSLPELVTALTAVRKGHGELAVGNVIGADILNVLFVSGAAAAVTQGGLAASPQFFQFLFPAMIGVLVIFRVGVAFSGDSLKRPFGVVLLAVYVAVTAASYFFQGGPAH